MAWAADYKVWGEAKVWQGLRTGTNDLAMGWSLSQRRAPTPALEQPFRFQGQQFDEETGLHYNRFRYYDPVVGRFVSQDLIGLAGGVNVFSFAPNPLDFMDPLGLAGAKAILEGPNFPKTSGLSTGEGGAGIHNSSVQQAYDNVPKSIRTEIFHGHCAEADALSKAANAAGVINIEQLKQLRVAYMDTARITSDLGA